MERESGKFACAHQARWVSEVQPFFVPLTLRCGLDSLEYTEVKKVAPRRIVSWRNGSTVTSSASRRYDIFSTLTPQNIASRLAFDEKRAPQQSQLVEHVNCIVTPRDIETRTEHRSCEMTDNC